MKCPNKAQSCKGSRIEMQRGLLVNWGQPCQLHIVIRGPVLRCTCNLTGVMLDSDISRAFICPNSLACPGGVLSDLKSEQNRPMCAKGGQVELGCVPFRTC